MHRASRRRNPSFYLYCRLAFNNQRNMLNHFPKQPPFPLSRVLPDQQNHAPPAIVAQKPSLPRIAWSHQPKAVHVLFSLTKTSDAENLNWRTSNVSINHPHNSRDNQSMHVLVTICKKVPTGSDRWPRKKGRPNTSPSIEVQMPQRWRPHNLTSANTGEGMRAGRGAGVGGAGGGGRGCLIPELISLNLCD